MKHLRLISEIILTLFFVSGSLIAQDTTLTVTGEGNVGIGTSNPQQKLHVKGLARFDLGGSQINISTPGGNPGIITFAPNGHRRDIVLEDLAMRLTVSPTSAAPSGANGITITEDGNVGIENFYPSEKLDVNGNAHISGKITSGDAKVSLPIAYGVINADGSVHTATSNVSCSWSASLLRYQIIISDESFSYSYLEYVTTVQPVGEDPVMTSTSSAGGNLLVTVFNSSGSKIQNIFHFVVYKP